MTVPGGTVRRGSSAAIGLFLVAILGGCEVGPDYKQSEPTLSAFHNLSDVSGGRAVTPAPRLDQWWTGFNDRELVTVVQRALAQNLDLAGALARVQEAQAAASGARANLLPTVDFDTDVTAQHQSLRGPTGAFAKESPGYDRGQHDYSLSTAASWEIDLAGGLRRESAAANDEAQAAQVLQAGTRITVAADAADAYLQVRGLQARLVLAQNQIDTDARLLKIVQVRYVAGQAEYREVVQADALLKQARTTVPELRIALEAQLNRLDVLMGVQPGTYAKELAQSAPIPDIPAIGDDNQPLNVLRRRPDVIAAERRLAASNERIGAAISDYYPKVSLSGALGFDSLSVSHLFSAKAFEPIGTGALRWRLFDFGKVKSEVAAARGANAEALSQYRQSILKAAEDVENALMALSQTELRVQELQGEVDSLTQARDLSQRAYEAGAITLTDVLDANRELLTARDELAQTRTNAARAAVETFRSLGGGWDVPRNSDIVAENEE